MSNSCPSTKGQKRSTTEPHPVAKRTRAASSNEKHLYHTSDPFPFTDLALVVEGKKLYVAKSFLAEISPVFKQMFALDFREKHQSELKLPDKSYDAIVEFLRVLNPMINAPINKKNVLRIIPLADEYQVEGLKEDCEEFLIKELDMYLEVIDSLKPHHHFLPVVEKPKPPKFRTLVSSILFAETYNMPELLEKGVSVASQVTAEDLARNPDFKNISVDTRHKIALSRVNLLQNENVRLSKKVKKYKIMAGKINHTF